MSSGGWDELFVVTPSRLVFSCAGGALRFETEAARAVTGAELYGGSETGLLRFSAAANASSK